MEPAITKEAEPPSFLSSAKNLMSMIADLCIDEAFFVVLPEPLYAPCAFMFITHIIPVRALDTPGHVVPILIPHSLKSKKLQQDMVSP